MKRILSTSLLAVMTAAALLSSCKEKEEPVKTFSGTITIDESALGEAPSPGSYDVTLNNVGTGQTVAYTTDGTSVAVSDIVPGIYNITAQANGTLGGSTYNYIGTASNVTLDATVVDAIKVSVAATKASALIFKEIHYNATKTLPNESGKTSTYLKDTFFEIYNNSDATVYLDGICLGDPLGATTFDFSAQAANLKHPVQDYIFIGTYVWQIPGNGTQYPLAPGESCIIAASAINHAATANTLDLSTAEFEAICQKYIDKGGQTDANAINLNLRCTVKETGLGNQLGNFVGTAWALFYPSEGLRKDGEYLESNKANNYGQEVLISDVLDAVECVKNETTDKKLVNVLDAGKVWCATTGGNQSIVRKTAGYASDGRVIYQDTNNSSVDFEVNAKPEIRRGGAKRPSWSSWKTAQ